MLVLTQADVQRLLPMDACMDVMTDALKSLAAMRCCRCGTFTDYRMPADCWP